MEIEASRLILATILSTFVGGSLGLFGGGGSFLTMPILLYALGLATHEAIATSLLVVGGTSLGALVAHARGGRVRWATGLAFGAASMGAAFVAGRFAHRLPGTALLLLFGGTMIAAAAAMMGKRGGKAGGIPEESPRVGARRRVVDGLVVGTITGLVGAGGGFLVVPALVLFGGLAMGEAVGTSLLVIVMNALAALAGHLGSTTIDYALGGAMTGAAVLGSVIGAAWSVRLPQGLLRRGFAWFVLVMAVFLLSQEVPRAAGFEVDLGSHWPWILGGLTVPVVGAAVDLRRRRWQDEGKAATAEGPQAAPGT